MSEMSVRALSENIGAEVTNVDLACPLSSAAASTLRAALFEHGLLVFRDQQLSEAAHVAFTRHFGEPEVHVRAQDGDHTPGIFIVSNIVKGGKAIGALGHGEVGFHSDLAYMARPGSISTLNAIEVPDDGGDTSWCGGYAAYAALSPSLKRAIDGKRAVHQHVSTELNPDEPVDHPLVCKHPETGRPTLFVTPLFAKYVVGMPKDESDGLLAELCNHFVRPEFTWTHRWRPGDLLVWDNRATIHSRSAFAHEQRRLMKRTQVFCTERPRPWSGEGMQ